MYHLPKDDAGNLCNRAPKAIIYGIKFIVMLNALSVPVVIELFDTTINHLNPSGISIRKSVSVYLI